MPVVSIAASPNGEIYFGGYSINRINSVIEGGKTRTMDSIYLDLPSNYDIADLQLDSAKRRLDLSLNQPIPSKGGENYLTIKIPTSLLTEVYKVTGDNPLHESAGSSKNGTAAVPSLEINFTVEESLR